VFNQVHATVTKVVGVFVRFRARRFSRGFKMEHNYIKTVVKRGVLAEEASDLMKRFFLLKRR
jgi:hypothetical protein